MVDANNIKIFSGNGFILVPWGPPARDGTIARWSNDEISTLLVLMSFENKDTREAYPSLDTIAALAGMSKTTVAKGIDKLKGHWLTVVQKPVGKGRSKNVYKMIYARYDYDDSKTWIKIHHNIIKNGMWAIMPPSVRRLYLVLKAFCMPGSYANAGWIEYEYGDGSWHGLAEDFDFMPASVFDGFGKARPSLSELCGIQEKTCRDARAWLSDKGMMRHYEGDYCHGLAFPYDVGKYVPKVLQALQEKKARQEISRKECTGGAKKAMRAIKVRTRQAQAGQIPDDPRVKNVPVNAADSVPMTIPQ